MAINHEEMINEKKKLETVTKILRNTLSDLGQNLYDEEEKIKEFRKFTWENRGDFDAAEMKTLFTDDVLEAKKLIRKGEHFKKLFIIQDNPYFARIVFENEKGEIFDIYMGLTYLRDKNNNNVIYDWRSPICSLFYDYELGKCSYSSPSGIIKGQLTKKRQYKIEKGKLIRIFDNELNIDDDLLQEVLASDSTKKMKNIVNTIQMEQNSVIRNTDNKNLIVQGIAGSGKTSVALHRIAYLLYKIENLNSNNVLIFSPNQIFTEYISNVLPELGEDNTLQTTFHDYLSKNLNEYNKVESFLDFLERYYKGNEKNVDLVRYKQSDEIINDINNYIDDIGKNIRFTKGISLEVFDTSINMLNEMFFNKYLKFPIKERLVNMAIKLSEINYNGSKKKYKTYLKLLKESLSIDLDYKNIYKNFYKSKYCRIELDDSYINEFVSGKDIMYEDALLFSYIKGLLEGFNYESGILEVVIDEAQDYSYLQYLIISKIFKKASFTILGDVNQTINPYYKYDSIEKLSSIFKDNTKYIELNKTYRSTKEIIDYTNNILGLNHVSAIRNDKKEEVLVRNNISSLKDILLMDIKRLKEKHKSLAIITKNDIDANYLYDLIKNDIEISLISNQTKKFRKDLLIIPVYVAKGLEFDSVIIYNNFNKEDKYLFYVASTRAQHELVIYDI